MRLDVKPLVWVEGIGCLLARGYCVHISFGSDSYYFATIDMQNGVEIYNGDDLPSAHAAANAHHAAHVRSQVAGVRMSDEEAYALSGAAINSWSAGNNASHALASVQAAIAAMQVGE